jgi:hypothetical protein
MISMIRNSEDFMNSYKAFLRDWKINKIIDWFFWWYKYYLYICIREMKHKMDVF